MMAENFFSLGCLLYAIMFKLPPAEGAIKFTLEPPNPSYARNGSNAKLVWDYSVDNPQTELEGIIYSVQVSSGTFTNMLGLQNDGTVITFSTIPNEYKGRVRIEGRASLVIENITSQNDSAGFMCTLVAKTGRDVMSVVQLIVTAGQIKFTSKYDGKTVTGLVGSSVNFTWGFSGDVDSVIWGLKKNGVDVIKNDGQLVSLDKNGPVSLTVSSAYSGRVSGSGVASSGQVTFTLSLIRMSDKGFYGCTIMPTDVFMQEKFDSVYLAVKEAPQISISSVPASYNEGSSVNISCTASGTPDPYVQWIRNGNVKSTGKKTVFATFNSINRADDGQYTCKANNSAGKDEKQTTLVVHYKPEGTTLNTSAADNTVTQRRSVTFTCHATAAQPQVSRYSFYLNDTTLVKDSNDSQYTINNVQRSQHYGKYKCVPQNDVGDGPEAAVILNVNVPVQFTTLPPNKTVNETSPIVLNCDASGFPEPSFTWTKGRQRLSRSRQLNIQRSQRSDAGMYVCTASNGVGQDKAAKIYVTVQYPPTVKAATTSTNKSWIGQTVKLTCESDGVPIPTLTWNKPVGRQIKSVTATQNTVNVKMSVDQDFGDYMCNADNGLTTADFKIVKIQQIKEPGFPTIANLDMQATSLTVEWTAPADDGGSPITAYRVVILKGGMVIKNENITDPSTTSWTGGDLTGSTNYTVKVFARNTVYEGPPAEKEVRTKYEGKSNDLCPTDVAFILDSSKSIKDEDFNDEKEIVKKLVMNLDIAPDKNRAALVRFSTSPLLEARFGEYETAYKFQDVLEKLPKMGKRTRIDRALNLAENRIFPEARKGVNKMTIILTDGVQSTGAQGLRSSSKPLRDAGVRVIAVGVGVGKRERRLRLMTDRDEDVVGLKNVQGRLQEILDDLSQNGCNQLSKPPAQKKCEDESVYEHECKKNIKVKSKRFCLDHPDFSFIHCQKSCDLCPLL